MLIHTYLFTLGAVLGSFFNVVGLRVPEGQSIVHPRSACPNCHHTLTPKELIPIFSFMFQRGACSNCRKRISPIYPFMELVTALLFAAAPLVIGWSPELLVAFTLVSLCSIIIVSDVRYMIIPDNVLLFFLPLFVAERVFIPLDPWWDPLAGLLLGAFIPFVIILASRGGMGAGDMKLLGVLGIALGWKLVLLAFFLSTLYGTAAGLAGMAFGKVKKGKPFPFGPFIVLGALTAYFYGEILIHWYVSSFFVL
ncbi:prepilin peptidase [Bacillus mangrovi]|uniref:Prepilin peptidase n=1 Tax=Metabacillus mangrovi TaxID=1491830 RepID=A0A7X2S537_9BACI|nr:prepilin peptidase [Metabacillus mangrovi]